MKKMYALVCALFITAASFAQGKLNIVIFSEDGEPFFAYVNGIRQNNNAETNIRITDLTTESFHFRIVFANSGNEPLTKNQYLPFGSEYTFKIKKAKKGFKLAPFGQVALNESTSTAPSYTYSTTETPVSSNTSNSVSTTATDASNSNSLSTTATGTGNSNTVNGTTSKTSETITTTTTTTYNEPVNSNSVSNSTGSGNENVSINMNVSENGLNMNMNVNGTGNSNGVSNTNTNGAVNGNVSVNVNGTNTGTATTSANTTGTSTSVTSTTTTTTYSSTGTVIEPTNNNTTTTTNTTNNNTAANTNTSYSTTTPTLCTYAMGDGDFTKLKSSVEAKSFEDTKMSTARQATKNACLNTTQIGEIMKLFMMDEQKLEYAKFAYDYCTEKQNYYQLADVLGYSSTQEEFNAWLDKK